MSPWHTLGRPVATLATLLLMVSCAAMPTLPSTTPTPIVVATIGATSPPVEQPTALGAPLQSFQLLASYPHDPQAFTQGLIYTGGNTYYESTGYYEFSSLREVELTTGQVQRQLMLSTIAPPGPYYHFAEGSALVGTQIFQLTWQSGFGIIYDRDTFAEQGRFRYPPPGDTLPREGWGLTSDGTRLIMSDGTANLYVVDPVATAATGSLALIGQVEVRDDLGPVTNLNELEYINGEIFANIWQRDLIARIDPVSGSVISYLDLHELRALLPSGGRPEVLNGIAYDAANDQLLVTGKWWPTLFVIRLEPLARYYLYLPTVAILPSDSNHMASSANPPSSELTAQRSFLSQFPMVIG